MTEQAPASAPEAPETPQPLATREGNEIPKDARTTAMLAHLLAVFTGFIGPLVIYLTKKDEHEFIRFHALQCLYFELMVIVASFACIPLLFVLIGFLLLPAVGIGSLILNIIACIKANDGEWFEYPLAGKWARN